jgi:glycogen(starch) synthase
MRTHVASVFAVSPRRITTIQNAIDPGDLEPVAEDLQRLRRRFAAPNERLVLMVGRLVYEKGFHVALDALAAVIRRQRNVRFVVAGTGTAEQELKRQARRLRLTRHGTFLGWIGDDMLHSLYRIADLCIVPSVYEPFGLVTLEAMASGCLCVVADTGGLREVVPEDGSVGHRFPSRDADALSGLVADVLGDDAARARAVTAAREHVLRFDWGEVARSTLALYHELASAVPVPSG